MNDGGGYSLNGGDGAEKLVVDKHEVDKHEFDEVLHSPMYAVAYKPEPHLLDDCWSILLEHVGLGEYRKPQRPRRPAE